MGKFVKKICDYTIGKLRLYCFMNIKILVATHKLYWMPNDSVYVPIQVGKAGKNNLGYLTDDTGDNISAKNAHYCELTGIYWAWKHLKCDYIGLCHYRRYFGYDTYCEDVEKIKSTIFTRSDYERLLCQHDVILPKISKIGNRLTVREEYERAHYGKDLKEVEYIVKKLYPEYKESMENVLNGKYIHYFNMFVMRKNLFDSYCRWLFDILFELEKHIDISSYDSYQSRIFGFLSERLLNIWMDKNKPDIVEADVVSLEPEKTSIWKKLKYEVLFKLK